MDQNVTDPNSCLLPIALQEALHTLCPRPHLQYMYNTLECPKFQVFFKNDLWKLHIVSYHAFCQNKRSNSIFSYIFSWFELWSFYPVEHILNQDIVIFIYSRGKSNFKSRKNRKNFHKTLLKAHKWKKDIKSNILM